VRRGSGRGSGRSCRCWPRWCGRLARLPGRSPKRPAPMSWSPAAWALRRPAIQFWLAWVWRPRSKGFVLGAGWPAGACASGFGNTGRAGEVGADVPEPPSDPGRGEPVGACGFLPGPAEVFGEGPGEPELGVGDDQDPGPAVRGLGSTEFRGGPAEGLFREAEGVLQVEAAEKRLPVLPRKPPPSAGSITADPATGGDAVAAMISQPLRGLERKSVSAAQRVRRDGSRNAVPQVREAGHLLGASTGTRR
jgi:hypothetical protein